eukprot:6185841-Pleurochrysis_carterae.AAC.1
MGCAPKDEPAPILWEVSPEQVHTQIDFRLRPGEQACMLNVVRTDTLTEDACWSSSPPSSPPSVQFRHRLPFSRARRTSFVVGAERSKLTHVQRRREHASSLRLEATKAADLSRKAGTTPVQAQSDEGERARTPRERQGKDTRVGQAEP